MHSVQIKIFIVILRSIVFPIQHAYDCPSDIIDEISSKQPLSEILEEPDVVTEKPFVESACTLQVHMFIWDKT